MVVESFVVISVILAVALILIWAGKKHYSYGVLPLVIIPVFNLLSTYISEIVISIFKTNSTDTKRAIMCTALAVSCMVFGFSTKWAKSVLSKVVYSFIFVLIALFLTLFLFEV